MSFAYQTERLNQIVVAAGLIAAKPGRQFVALDPVRVVDPLAHGICFELSGRMKTKSNLAAFMVLLLSIFLLGVPTFGLTEASKDGDIYQKTERAYVLSATNEVEAACNPGDVLLKGECEGVNSAQFPDESVRLVFLDSEKKNESTWVCKVRVIHPLQIIRISSIATCKKVETQARL